MISGRDKFQFFGLVFHSKVKERSEAVKGAGRRLGPSLGGDPGPFQGRRGVPGGVPDEDPSSQLAGPLVS